MKSKYLVTAVLASTLFNITYAKEGHQQHDAHEHGHAQLNIAQEGSTVTMQFISPAMNIVGFEHQPKTEEQKTQVKQAIKQLENGNALFGFPEKAGCKLTSAKVETALMEAHDDHDDEHGEKEKHHKKDHHDDEDHHDEHKEESHSEFEVEYSFSCSQPKQFHQLQVRLFETFKGIEEVRTQYISDKGQQGFELTPKVSVFNLP
ncbi:DUF2796 domain-containing protein [Endozoicomonas sp. SM1973]|uniref:DUF2796 domain-containing protein n=1 Tax=Spartinivicinus marinus TaxID=2994442 RepID=A0A853I8I0_9GAMM|nr:DUF2796 domain-containing protein [Spartinivicinus marinus]MCX4028706.1 DUF2796 domain-containing protein [Spartinivicinus marinus]NYZ68032.1 DUF2796 domain-containing protein [Spartinivicinus marinus]